jgi:hypothetical protein
MFTSFSRTPREALTVNEQFHFLGEVMVEVEESGCKHWVGCSRHALHGSSSDFTPTTRRLSPSSTTSSIDFTQLLGINIVPLFPVSPMVRCPIDSVLPANLAFLATSPSIWLATVDSSICLERRSSTNVCSPGTVFAPDEWIALSEEVTEV